MAYLVGLLFWIGLIVYCIYSWHTVNPHTFMPELGYLFVVTTGVLGTLVTLVYFVLVFWHYEQYKYMFITLAVLVLMITFFWGTPFLS